MQTKEKYNKFKVIFLILIIVFLIVVFNFIWAKYQTVLKSEGEGEFAKWVFKVNGYDTQTTDLIDFAITRTDIDNDSVKENVLAPGTEGVFDIEIDASGTDTFISYSIDINLIKKPQNLKFYLKNSSNEKIFISDINDHLTTNGFISLTESKVRTERIFWIWELSTGSDPDEIRTNDLYDSQWIGEKMEMQISVTGMQVQGPGDTAIPKGTLAQYDFSNVSWYNINESKLSGVNTNGFTAESHNVTYGENYLEFNGTNSWVNLGVINNGKMTLEVTFMVHNYATREEKAKLIIGNQELGGIGISLYEDKLGAAYYIDGGYKYSDRIDIELNTIYNVIYTYDGEKACLYLNGEKKDELEYAGAIYFGFPTTPMSLGANPTSWGSVSNEFLDGKIYSAAVYDRALSEQEIEEHARIALEHANL